MANIEYLITLLIVLALSIAIHIHFKMDLFKKKQYLYIFVVFIIIGFIWDYIGVLRGFWSYGNGMGITTFNLPVEELLFYIVIPYFIIVVYRATRQNKKEPNKRKKGRK